ncbi:rhodanese-related sulfurtransferase [filamentous cyanobacterium LEGE 11480]|uniref:tRNA uridine(34) hydroxylase n=1 Tax=Romeriopsis navalis LEGE 11480 TaxID=2777977 RepID=A0A928VTA2_9CYAN|nr:rhodanese-related sulfurtransferase [Romeriopsis navalis]MBE9031689.1 rhodanese-related sulfurtransferase [Romeriopsis navalis LEGE 11480]
MAYLVAAFYKFVSLSDCHSIRSTLLERCADQGVKGTILLAEEGINGTICGTEASVRNVFAYLEQDSRFARLDIKESWSPQMSFAKLKVKVKKEIVTFGQPQANPAKQVGTYVKPEDWNAVIADPEVLVIDTRNDFEVGVGSFQRAVNPQTNSFREFPEYVEQLDPETHKKVAMFCTGGIRCEKASAYMLDQGFDQVYHLEGGILKYLETVPADDSLWEGECYVFDQRVTVIHGVEPGSYDNCAGCGHPVSPAEMQSPQYEAGISCPHCYDKLTDDQRERFTERKKQILLKRERAAQG